MDTECTDCRTAGPSCRPVMRMPTEDIQYIAGDAHHWRRRETGGAIYGLWTYRGEPVVLLATEAGPGATREAAHFAQDPEYVTAVNRDLWRGCGVQYIGTWHSHHDMPLPNPSGGDVRQVRGLAGRNGLQRMVQIILTREQERPSPRLMYHLGIRRSRSVANVASGASTLAKADDGPRPDSDLPHIRVNAFVYQDAQTGSYTQAEVRTTECGSPFRGMLKGSSISAFQDLSEDALYPLDRIILGNAEIEGQAAEGISDILSILAEQVSRLPRGVAERVEAVPTEDSVILRLPLSNDRQAIVHYDSRDRSLTPRSVHLAVPAVPKPVDITAVALAHRCAFLLDVLYEWADSIQLPSSGLGCDPQPPESSPVTHDLERATPDTPSRRCTSGSSMERKHTHVD